MKHDNQRLPSYTYYDSSKRTIATDQRNAALRLGEDRRRPSLRHVDFLVQRKRIVILSKWISELPALPLRVLDIGGRIQPYRPYFKSLEQYVSFDLQFDGLIDFVADAHVIPIHDAKMDVVVCTQVMSYVNNPSLVVEEIYRVLKPGGILLLSAPSFFPQHHDEKWRFTKLGLQHILSPFQQNAIVAETFSMAGLCRSLNYVLHGSIKHYRVKQFASWTTIPTINSLGLFLDKFATGNEICTANYCARAIK